LAAHVDELAAGVARLTAEQQDLSAAVLPADYTGPDKAVGGSEARSDDSVVPVLGRLEVWVTGYFLPTFRRPFGREVRWCAAWQEHAEAVVRLEGLWSSWQALQVEPKLGIITWLTHSGRRRRTRVLPDRYPRPCRSPWAAIVGASTYLGADRGRHRVPARGSPLQWRR
jgi:hypothetical protein